MKVDPRGTWSDFDTEFWLPEVIEVRSMTKAAIEGRFGEQSSLKDDADKSEHDIFIWANHWWMAAILLHAEEDSVMLTKYEHKFRRSPYECMEAELAPDNKLGIRWFGALYYARDKLDAYDEALSELRELMRDDTRRPRIIKVEREGYPDEQLSGGRPQDIDIHDGMVMFMDEDIVLGPTSELNAEHNRYLQEIKSDIRETMIRPVERGAVLSGQSQNLFTTAVQIAEREFDPSMKAITQHAERTIERFLCAVESLGEAVPLFHEQKGKGMIEVTPAEAKRWKYAVQARASRAIPIDQNVIASTAERWKGLGLSTETVYEVVMGIQNPDAERRKTRLEQLDQAAWENIELPALLERLAIPGETSDAQKAQLQESMANASPDLQAFIQEQQQGPGRSAAGQQKQGIPQSPQEPQEVTTG